MDASKPLYLLAGGRTKGPTAILPFLHGIFRESGQSSPTIGYVGAANNDSPFFFEAMVGILKAGGAHCISRVLLVSPQANIKKALCILEAVDIIFIAGGDVERGMQVLTDRDLCGRLKVLFQQGKVFFGTSAGSIMLAREWVRWRDSEDDATAEVFPCLGLAPIICDTHGEQDDWDELRALLGLKMVGETGYGITSGAVLKVWPDGRLEALGASVRRYVRHASEVAELDDLLPTT